MKTRIIRTLIILIALLPSLASFRYLDHECAFLGRSILDKEHTLNSIGIGVSLYTGCPGSIEFTDKKTAIFAVISPGFQIQNVLRNLRKRPDFCTI